MLSSGLDLTLERKLVLENTSFIYDGSVFYGFLTKFAIMFHKNILVTIGKTFYHINGHSDHKPILNTKDTSLEFSIGDKSITLFRSEEFYRTFDLGPEFVNNKNINLMDSMFGNLGNESEYCTEESYQPSEKIIRNGIESETEIRKNDFDIESYINSEGIRQELNFMDDDYKTNKDMYDPFALYEKAKLEEQKEKIEYDTQAEIKMKEELDRLYNETLNNYSSANQEINNYNSEKINQNHNTYKVDDQYCNNFMWESCSGSLSINLSNQ